MLGGVHEGNRGLSARLQQVEEAFLPTPPKPDLQMAAKVKGQRSRIDSPRDPPHVSIWSGSKVAETGDPKREASEEGSVRIMKAPAAAACTSEPTDVSGNKHDLRPGGS